MYTQCPECLTVYKLEAELLVPACGCVRCGHCDAVFNALGTLAAHLPPEPFTRLAEHALDREPPGVDVAVFRPKPAPAPTPEPGPFVHVPPAAAAVAAPLRFDATPGGASDAAIAHVEHVPAGAPAPSPVAEDDFSQLTFTPRFARTKKRNAWRTVAWVSACTLLVLGLGAQLAWAKRDTLVADATMGPVLQAACHVLGCQLPLVAAPSQLRLLARNVEQHPSVPDGLLITASVHNDAGFGQPYPVVTIVLSDAAGNRLAMRRFQPSDYVGDAAARARGLAPDATTAMVFEVQDPGQRAVAFAFSFE